MAKPEPTDPVALSKAALLADPVEEIVRATLREALEAEMTDALGVAKGERSEARRGYRSGHYPRTLVTRVGKLERRVPQDRDGRFSTELVARYQRSEQALVASLAEMYVQGGLDPEGPGDHRGTLRPRLLVQRDLRDRQDPRRPSRGLRLAPVGGGLPLPDPPRHDPV